MVGGWDGTGSIAAKDTVAEPCDDGIAELAQGAGNTGEESTEAGPALPGVAEDLQGADDGVGATVEALVRGEGVGN